MQSDSLEICLQKIWKYTEVNGIFYRIFCQPNLFALYMICKRSEYKPSTVTQALPQV